MESPVDWFAIELWLVTVALVLLLCRKVAWAAAASGGTASKCRKVKVLAITWNQLGYASLVGDRSLPDSIYREKYRNEPSHCAIVTLLHGKVTSLRFWPVKKVIIRTRNPVPGSRHQIYQQKINTNITPTPCLK